MKREVLPEVDQARELRRGEADQHLEALGEHVVADGHADEEQRPGDDGEDRVQRFSWACRPGTMKPQICVEPVGAGDHDRGDAAQLQLQQQRAADAVDGRRRSGLALAERSRRLVVGVVDELEAAGRRRTARRSSAMTRTSTEPQQPGPQLPQVVRERHPPVGADRLCGLRAEQPDDSGDGHDGSGAGVTGAVSARCRARGSASRLRLGVSRRSAASARRCASSWRCASVFSDSLTSSSSSSSRPLVSALKMRSARPLPRASSGSFLAPKQEHDDQDDQDDLGRAETDGERRDRLSCLPLRLSSALTIVRVRVRRRGTGGWPVPGDTISGVVEQRLGGHQANTVRQVGRVDQLGRRRPSRSISRVSQAGSPTRIRTVSPPPRACGCPRPGSTPRPSGRVGSEPQGHQQVVRRGLEDPVGQVPRLEDKRSGGAMDDPTQCDAYDSFTEGVGKVASWNESLRRRFIRYFSRYARRPDVRLYRSMIWQGFRVSQEKSNNTSWPSWKVLLRGRKTPLNKARRPSGMTKGAF